MDSLAGIKYYLIYMKRFIAIAAITIFAFLTASSSLACKNKYLDLPEQYPEKLAIKNKDIVADSYQNAFNLDRFYRFIANVEKKRKDVIRITTYTDEQNTDVSFFDPEGRPLEYSVGYIDAVDHIDSNLPSFNVTITVMNFDGKVINIYRDYSRNKLYKNRGIERLNALKITNKVLLKQLDEYYDSQITKYYLTGQNDKKNDKPLIVIQKIIEHIVVEKVVRTETKHLNKDDLNGDGKLDIISMRIVHKTVDSKPGGPLLDTFKINNTRLKINDPYFNPEDLTIVDINKKDKFKEIAVSSSSDGGEDWDTTFYHYDGNKIISLGSITGAFYKQIGAGYPSSILIDGSGKLSTYEQGAIGYNWFYINHYRLVNDHKLENTPQKLYPIASKDEPTVKYKLSLQRSPTDRRTAAVLKPGDKVKFLASDNKAWFQIKTSKGVKGWLSVGNFDSIQGSKHTLQDLFDELSLAD